ncbi:MAG: alpha-amylase family glycosyl hydrolase [Bilifractor porci]
MLTEAETVLYDRGRGCAFPETGKGTVTQKKQKENRREHVMAEKTNLDLRNRVMYMVFVRNYSREGTFRRLQEDLPRIQSLGVDYIWLLPIQPLGVKNRKGTLGSPYAIRDYRAVNPEYGTKEDLRALTDAIHELGMKCILDIVYNHTSPDSVLAAEHPEWFYHKEDGSLGNRIGDWSDIVDLDYSHPELWDYQIETLKMWAEYFDGFRCDVAPMVPLSFWLKAREEVEKVHPGMVWIAESVEPRFILWNRERGIPVSSDSELYQAFDICYDYDISKEMSDAMLGKAPLSVYLEAMNRQEWIYGQNYIKLRNLENHDRNRAAALIPNEQALRSWTAFLYFAKGTTLLYAGQEKGVTHHPSLFDRDTVDWKGTADLTEEIRLLSGLKRKDRVFREGAFSVSTPDEKNIVASYVCGEEKLTGIFPLHGAASVSVQLPDGTYRNLYSGKNADIYENVITTDGEPVIIRT